MKIANNCMMAQTAMSERKVTNSKDLLVSASDAKQTQNGAKAFDSELSRAESKNQLHDNDEIASKAETDNVQEEAKVEDIPAAVEPKEVEADVSTDEKDAQVDFEKNEQFADVDKITDSAAILVAMASTAMIVQQQQQQQAIVTEQQESVDVPLKAPIEAVEPVADALEALLPQDEEANKQALQNGQLMEMLQGKAIADPRITEKVQQNVQQTVQPEAAEVSAEISATAPAAVNLHNTAPVDKKLLEKNEDKRSNILEGIPLIVEDKIVVNDDQAQMSGDMLQKQPKGDQEQILKLSVDGKLVQQGEELSEEADFDTVKVIGNKDVNAANQVAGTNSFVQSFSEVAASEKVAENASLQPDNFDIPKQIIEQAKLIRSNEDTQMVIRLKPDHLGELTLKISVSHGGTVNASFHSDNAQVRGIIESTMVQLKQELSEQGLKVDNVDVKTALDDSFLMDSQAGQQGYYAQQQSQGGKTVRNQKADIDSFEADAEATAVRPADVAEAASTIGADGVDYLV